jgi:hypothetical protein
MRENAVGLAEWNARQAKVASSKDTRQYSVTHGWGKWCVVEAGRNLKRRAAAVNEADEAVFVSY